MEPVRGHQVIDCFSTHQQVVADDTIYFCRPAKETWHRPLLTGVFYGYVHVMFNRQTGEVLLK